MNKVIRDGKVAVLYSPRYGAGWYSWHDKEELLFDPEVVHLVEENKREEIPKYVDQKYPGEYVCSLGAEDLSIEWVPEGTRILIDEYDGFESITYFKDLNYIIA